MGIAIGHMLDQGGAEIAARALHRPLGHRMHCQIVIAVDPQGRNASPGRAPRGAEPPRAIPGEMAHWLLTMFSTTGARYVEAKTSGVKSLSAVEPSPIQATAIRIAADREAMAQPTAWGTG